MTHHKAPCAAADATRAVTAFFEEVLGKTPRVIALESDPQGWRVMVEIVEDSDYLRRIGRSDMVGIYEAHIGRDLEVVSYARKGLRDRTARDVTEISVG